MSWQKVVLSSKSYLAPRLIAVATLLLINHPVKWENFQFTAAPAPVPIIADTVSIPKTADSVMTIGGNIKATNTALPLQQSEFVQDEQNQDNDDEWEEYEEE